MKRILFLILSLTLCLTLLPATVQVQAASVDDLSYKITNGQVIITNCKESASGSLTIPDTIDGYPVTGIGENAFSSCYSLTSITIPDSVTSIRNGAFSSCFSLSSITIPDGVTSIGSGAFYNCNSLTGISIPGSTTTIGDSAFNGCTSLTSISIPDSVTSIGDSAFSDCIRLKNISYTGTHKQWNAISIGSVNTALTDNIVQTLCGQTEVTVTDYCTVTVETCNSCKGVLQVTPNGGNHRFLSGSCTKCGISRMLSYYSISSTGGVTITDCDTAASGELVIPSTIEGCPVTGIGNEAFYHCQSLTSISIPNSVTSIGYSAFYNCNSLTSINIPDSVTSIGEWVFYNCDMTSISIPDSVTSIGDCAFRYCTSLTSISIPDGVTSIGEYAFEYCRSLTSIRIPDRLTSIGEGVFSGCSKLAAVVFHASVTSIPEGVFNSCTALDHVFYTGTEDQWFAMTVGVDNGDFLDANVHFNCTGEELTFREDCTSRSLYCGICEEVFYTWKVGNASHSYETVVVSPTCTEDGHTTYTCTACGYSYTTSQEATGHRFQVIVTEPTCTAIGYSCHSCENCDYCWYDNVVAATGHRYEAVVTAPTCMEEGYTTYTCHCGDSYTGDVVSATGHSYDDGICTACGAVEEKVEVLPGDLTGDGKLNIMDVARIYATVKSGSSIIDPGTMKVADYNGDGKVNIMDVAKLYATIKSGG